MAITEGHCQISRNSQEYLNIHGYIQQNFDRNSIFLRIVIGSDMIPSGWMFCRTIHETGL